MEAKHGTPEWKSGFYCHVSQWLRLGFGLVTGFMEYLQVLTINNYNTITNFHTTKNSTLISSVDLHLSSRIYNTETIQVSLNHTLSISLCCRTHKVFKSHVKSSQAHYLYSFSTTNFPWLSPIENWLVPEPNYVTYIAEERTCITGNTYHVTTIHLCVTSTKAQKTQPHLLLRVGLCLQSCCLATRWSNPLQYVIIQIN
jgi:hypothetical protein